MYVCTAALGLCCSWQAFSSCGDQGLLFVAVRRLLIVVASLVGRGLELANEATGSIGSSYVIEMTLW